MDFDLRTIDSAYSFVLNLLGFPQLSTLDLEWREHSTGYKINFYLLKAVGSIQF